MLLVSDRYQCQSGQPDAATLYAEEQARSLVASHMARNFQPSLETKENVDFLLTPALLVQEHLSGGSFPGYPAE
jgi:hypothetical protein